MIADTYGRIADTIRPYKTAVATQYDDLALESLRADRIHRNNIAWQNGQFSAFAPIVADLLQAGKLDEIPARRFLAAHSLQVKEAAS